MSRESKNVLSHAGIYLVARGLPGIMAFCTIPLFTRLLNPDDYGRYALIIATSGMLNALFYQWLRLSLVRFLPAYKENIQPLKATMVCLTSVLSTALAAVALVVWATPRFAEWRSVVWPCWLLLCVQAFYELCCEYSRGSLKPWRYMALQLARSGAIVGIGAGLILAGFSWRAPIFAASIGMGLAVAWVWRSDWSGIRPVIDRTILSKLAEYGVPLSITVALAVVIGTCDRFLIARYRGEYDAGLYSVAVDFTTQTLSLLLMVINLAVFPMAVRAFENHGRQAAQEQMRTNMTMLLAIGVPCTVGIMLLSPGISGCFLGDQYRSAAASIMPLIALGALLSGLKAYHYDSAFQFAHRTIYQVWIVLFVAILNIVLNVIAIPRWGINGSAIASVAAYIASIGLTWFFGRRHFTLPFPTRAAMQIALAAGAMALLLAPFRWYTGRIIVIEQIIAGAAVYGFVLLLLDFHGLRRSLWMKAIARRVATDSVSAQVTAAALVEA